MMKNNRSKAAGFTLIEIMTALTLFITIMTVSMGSIVGIFDANRKSQSLRTVMNNLNLSVESMSREMRFGKNYHCETTASAAPPFTSTKNCATGGKLVSFLSSDNKQIVYRMSGSSIEKSVDGGTSYVRVTAPEITIQDLTFYVVGAGITDDAQPKALVRIQGISGQADKPKNQTSFTIETLVSQRLLDI